MKPKQIISPFSVILVFVCLTLVGLFLIPELSVKLSPSQSLPQINVSFFMPNNSPRIVEIEATSKLEAMLSRMTGVQEITSISGNGKGDIYIRFDKHTDIDIARFEVSTIIRQTWPLLPPGVSYPSISLSKIDNRANTPFLSYTVNAPANPLVIQQFVETQVKPKLSQIEGVDRINVSGAAPMEWRLEYDYKRLDNLGISVHDIQQAVSDHLNKEHVGIVSIESDKGDKKWIRLVISSGGIDENRFGLSGIEVKDTSGKIIMLDQLVEVSRVESQPQSYYRVNGLNSIHLSVVAEENANQLNLSNKVKGKLDEVEINFPVGYNIHLNYDATEHIKSELNKIYFRTALTLTILLIFILLIYRNIKYTLLIVITLFINIAVAIIFYYLLRLEIQLYSLAGITISLTLVIDNTIVMSDQIIRRHNMKAFLPILAATLTSIAALSAIFLLDEKLRLNLEDFACIIIVNLSISLLISLFLVPALLEKMKILKRKKGAQNFLFGRLRNCRIWKGKRIWIYMNRAYEVICRFLYRWRIAFVVLIVLIFGLPVFMLPEKLEPVNKWADLYNDTFGSNTYKEKVKPHVDNILGGTLRLFVQKVYNASYFADREETSLYVTATLPSNSTIEQMNNLIQRMENYISQFDGVKYFQTDIHNARQASINIQFTKEHQRGGFPYLLKSKLISKSLELGGGSWGVYGLGDGFSNDVREVAGSYRVEMYGYNYDELVVLGKKIKEELLNHRRIKDVVVGAEFSWYKDDYEEFVLNVYKEKLAQEDIKPYQFYAALKNIFGQNVFVGSMLAESGTEQIVLHSRQSKEYDIWDFHNIPIKIDERELKLSDLAKVEKVQAPQKIAKVNQQYRLCLQYEYIGSTEQGRKILEENIGEFRKTLPMGYMIKDSNMSYWWSTSDKRHYLLLLYVFVVVYFLSGILFNSLKQPFYIISVIPISFIGIFLTFYLFRLNFDQGGFASFILLSGLTINANIYIIDEYNNIKSRYPGISMMRAYLKTWNAKIRPIFLTIVSTILGFIPFLIGEYHEAFWFPLAAGTIGGLIISFIATFLFLPLFMGVGKIKTAENHY